jgi:hypothetical protein
MQDDSQIREKSEPEKIEDEDEESFDEVDVG